LSSNVISSSQYRETTSNWQGQCIFYIIRYPQSMAARPMMSMIQREIFLDFVGGFGSKVFSPSCFEGPQSEPHVKHRAPA